MHIETFKAHFQPVKDARQSAKITYPLFDVLFGTLCSVIAGARGWFEIREYLLGQHEWFVEQGMFEEGIPVDDTIARIISSIKPELFQACFIEWMQSVHQLTDGELVAIDGKTLRGSYSREDRNATIHMVSAYSSANKLVLGQVKTDSKSNEITAIPELLKMLDLRGALVSIDAMGCQTKIANAIMTQGGDYFLAVKGNQSKLAKAVKSAFSAQRAADLEGDKLKIDVHHGRIESRRSYVFDADVLEGDFSRWKGLKTIVMVESFRAEKGKSVQLSHRYYISSKEMDEEQVANAAREHWGIESMHWMLDVSMQEDACQIYKDNAAANLACLRHMSLNMLRAEPTKLSIVGKQRRCWMKTAHLEKVLMAGISSMVKN
ncbi:ISAs1 family transposase [Oceanisphaera pacifica]|uniref:ISAs1 family transposase n=1 Tax=Oceanisphaera pacifica TaxID=2818389 RepID=A0ABS3NJK5_9GAMM|nr:ISAs1 family transposase [Oceanisphaera pacifica]MBO1520776.1 ISAs1 family transposase [Oceanisphaera pacifica]